MTCPTCGESEWVFIPCHTALEAVTRGVDTTGNRFLEYGGGDYGQDEGEKELGLGNEDFTVNIWPNGTAILAVRRADNDRYLERKP